MIQEKTTLILGAGASCHYGFPTGEGLIKQVCTEAGNLINLYEQNQHQRHTSILQSSEQLFQLVSDVFHGYTEDQKKRRKVVPQHHENEIFRKDAEDLKEKLFYFSFKIKQLDPLNIDTFLRDNPSLQDVGTFLIAFVLLKCEVLCKAVPENDYNKDKNKESNNWYRFLIHVLAACDNSEELKKVFLDEQKLSIITFNYDVSLEYHLYNSLKQIEKFQGDARDFMKEFSENCIFHVYGALHTIDWDAPDPFADFGSPFINDDDFLKKAEIAIKCSQNIKTIYKDKDNKCPKYTEKKKKFIEAIDQSKRLVILGYGFDDANTKHLSEISENDSRGLAKALSLLGKQRIFMTNYGDSKRIQNKITKINPAKIDPLIFISTKKVYNALMHDFDLV